MTEYLKPVYKKKVIEILIAYCPKCDHKLDEITDPDARTIASYQCPNCNWLY